MRRMLVSLLTLGTLFVCLPAQAQVTAPLSSLTLNPEGIRSGGISTATLTLVSSAPAGGVAVDVFTLHPSVFIAGNGRSTRIIVPAGSTTATFRVASLPFDVSTSTFIGATSGTSTVFARLTLWQWRPFRSRIAVFRPSTRTWFLRVEDGTVPSEQFGLTGDVPVPADYLAGNGDAQLAVYRPSTGQFIIRPNTNGGEQTIPLGNPGDIASPSGYLGTGRTQMSVFRPAAGLWLVRTDAGATLTNAVPFVQAGDLPVPGDYLGIGRALFAVYRPLTQQWIVRNDDGTTTTTQFGQAGDIPVPGNYLGTGRYQMAVFRPGTAEWVIRSDTGTLSTTQFGAQGDIPVPGDYLGIGRSLLAVFRPINATWYIRLDTGEAIQVQFGAPTDIPLQATFTSN